jgi:hypothetical protein
MRLRRRHQLTGPLVRDTRWVRRAGTCNEKLDYRLLLLLVLLLAAYGNAQADIYRYVNADGVTTFTNIRPSRGGYEIIVREGRGREAEQPGPVARKRVNPVRGYPIAVRTRYARHVGAAANAASLDPLLIHAVISAESGYNPSARSRKGAVGLMQLMPGTAARYGVANRYDPAQNVSAGARYLRDLLRLFDNNLVLALAAYNAGEQAVMKHGNRIPPYRETADYVPRVLDFYRAYRAGGV